MMRIYAVKIKDEELSKGIEYPITRQIYAFHTSEGFMQSKKGTKEGSIRVRPKAVEGGRENIIYYRVEYKQVIKAVGRDFGIRESNDSGVREFLVMTKDQYDAEEHRISWEQRLEIDA